MHILAVTAVLPYPPRDGRANRSWHLLKQAARDAAVTLLTWTLPETEPSWLATVQAEVGPVIAAPLAPVDTTTLPRSRRHVNFLFGGPPPYVQAFLEGRRGSITALSEQLRVTHRRQPFELVTMEEEALAMVPLPDFGVPRVLQRHNVFEQLIGALPRTTLERAIWLAERRGWRRFDRQTLATVDLAITPTPEAAKELRRIAPRVPVSVVNNGVDVRALRTSPSRGRHLAFIGWMNYQPNIDAVVWFAKRIWPDIASQHRATEFRVVGREPSPEVRGLHGWGVDVVGEVDDVVDACEGSRAGVVPLRAGMGIKTKTLELMSMGLPVIATPVGAEGLAAGPDDGLLVTHDEREFARAVDELLRDSERADRLGAAARRFVLRHHSWDTMGELFRNDLRNVVKNGTRQA